MSPYFLHIAIYLYKENKWERPWSLCDVTLRRLAVGYRRFGITSVPFQRVKTACRPETWVTSYQTSQRNTRKERRPQPHRGRRLKSRQMWVFIYVLELRWYDLKQNPRGPVRLSAQVSSILSIFLDFRSSSKQIPGHNKSGHDSFLPHPV